MDVYDEYKRWLIPKVLLAFLFSFQLMDSSAQKKWDGGGNDDQWSNPSNWEEDLVPAPGDEVLLDHSSVAGKYTVFLPSGSTQTILKSITINPQEGDSILMILPVTNTAIPGLQLTGTGHSLILYNRAVFTNASGATSGQPVVISDSIRINNGGVYIHRSARSHAANVTVLSVGPGTEEGVFEFDIPDASATISLSDRKFGKLKLSASAAKGTVNYIAAGTRGILVRSDLEIGNGVAVNLNFSDTLHIARNFLQRRGTFNCGTTARSLVIAIAGDIEQSQDGIITESGSGLPTILLNGRFLQRVAMQGLLSNSITFAMRSAGCILVDSLRLPYKLKLVSGVIKSSPSALLVLQTGCMIEADSLNNSSFVEGPMEKHGLAFQSFLFPVGRDQHIRWLCIREGTGNLQVEFIKSDPNALSRNYSAGLHHISRLEYWILTGDTEGQIELSFDDVNSGGVTEMNSLRVARLSNMEWKDEGNIGTTGNAGNAGSVVSNRISESGTGNRYFTLGSSVSNQNPLPIQPLFIYAFISNGNHRIVWNIQSGVSPEYTDLEFSDDGIHFNHLKKYLFDPLIKTYEFIRYDQSKDAYYRVYAVFPVERICSNIAFVGAVPLSQWKIYPTLASTRLTIEAAALKNERWTIEILDTHGRILHTIKRSISPQSLKWEINISDLHKGNYFLSAVNENEKKVFQFIKL
ncbi:MAG TPA: T9SS type A sorting domain-containing protein [Flavitalea sp.]|nr:T9SS type A sorting domain-containing protein [Flavitalea sp.]